MAILKVKMFIIKKQFLSVDLPVAVVVEYAHSFDIKEV